ncbi:transferrin-like isoform X2 [Chrysoperla carnea]|uniref:transferrin-like isoform X2 n=1 Tax=Chrysoperla carnea TaxID=189513 RepID=UPI001D0759FD|nr:transferrin-like isoform X2 [Chrysoperla carnea]
MKIMALSFVNLSIILLLSIIVSVSYGQTVFNVCAIEDVVPPSLCQEVKQEQSAECIQVPDSVNCAIKLQNGKANVAVFSPEQALVAAKALNDTVKVVASVRHPDDINEEFAFQSVVVVKKSFEGGLKSLSNKQYCHPGFDLEEKVSKRVLTEFENTVVPLKCGPSDSHAAEDEVGSVAKYFGKSCRPGPWVPNNEKIDKQLRDKYKNLCELCDNKEKCEYQSTDKNPHHDALRCLAYLGGDVAYVSLQHVKSYFGLTNSAVKKADPNDYQYLCPDGSVQPVATVNPCTWVKQPWPVIVVRNEIEDEFKAKIIDVELPAKKIWIEILRTILAPSNQKIIEVNTTNNIVAYLEDKNARKIPSPSEDKCKRNLKWCTVTTEEQDKCEWLSKSMISTGIRPEITCQLGANTIDCFKLISKGRADIISIDSNYGYIARKSYSLQPIYYHRTNEQSLTLAVIKDKDSDKYQTIQDLKGKNVCVPEYGGLAFISAVVLGLSTNLTRDAKSKLCDYGRDFSTFFNDGCVPGARDKDHGISAETNSDRLCALCQITELSKATCAADISNRFFGDKGALDCISFGGGDVALVDKSEVQDATNSSDYRVLCANNTLAASTGFNVDENCALSAIVDSETVTRPKDANNPAYELLLADIQSAFKNTNNKKFSAMSVFSKFNDHEDVLFKSNILGFDETKDPNSKYARNYDKLFSQVDKCTGAGAMGVFSSFATILFCLVAVFHLF